MNAVPTLSASWTTVFAAVINAIVSSNVLLAAAIEDAERSNASPIPPDDIAKLFNLLLSGITLTDHVILYMAISRFWLILVFHF